ncbi:ABC transporter permease subunit [Devosia rhodophyticola]|uniref:ABC transporter permease subunit n=1 Tax=Devosia rhodophyticola TaxID=3026423 RepID=A0ABY7YY81_9HYPH|nr:ABC transporter permease subunit [Devosia rhodophyticola]WDR06281.1 ABC transporter permease subunit [Devosia rhodophyticola]
MSDRLKIFLLLAPALTAIIVLFMGGLGIGLARSLNYMPVIGLVDPNFDAYVTVFTSQEFYLSFLLTLHISVTSTVLSSILAIGAALLLRRQFIGRAIINFLFQLNLTVPHLVGAIGILYLFSQSGSFARLAAEWGMISRPGDFPALVFDPYAIGIILQYVWKEVPFIGVILLANMQALGEDYESVARSLGANRWQAFRHVLLPLIFPGLLSASVMVFAFTFGAYEIPAILGPNYPAALPVLAYRKYTDVDLEARPEAMAMAIVIALLSALMIFLYVRISRRNIRS